MSTSSFAVVDLDEAMASPRELTSNWGGLRYALIAGSFALGTVIGTSASASTQPIFHSALRAPTHAGASFVDQRDALRPREGADAVLRAIRALTGFTWEQLATLLGVDRRSLHLWLTGGGIRPEHERQLFALRDLALLSNAGNQTETRAALLNAEFRGRPIRQMLVHGRLTIFKEDLRTPSPQARALENDFDIARLISRARMSRAHVPGRVTRTEARPTKQA